MDALCTLFDAVSCVSELLGRREEKADELSALLSTVGSVSQSVRSFALELPPHEREAVFRLNPVFSDLAHQLRQCEQVINKYREINNAREALEDDNKLGNVYRPLLSAVRRHWANGSRTLNEGLQAVSGRLGSLGTGLLCLPEDELAIIRQASAEMTRLVPLVHLAISAHVQRGARRGGSGRLASEVWIEPDSRSRPRVSLTSSASDTAGALDQGNNSLEDEPLLQLQLVSAEPGEFPALTTRHLRPILGGSSSSLDGGIGAPAEIVQRFMCGRAQLREHVPKTLRLPYGDQFQPVIAFVSKEHFVLDVSRSPPQAEAPDTMNMDTLNLGGEEDLGPTLALGSSTDSGVREQVPDATVYGLSQHGLHVRELGQNTWRWTPMKQRVELRYGDTIAVILVSPPNSTEPGPQRDLSDSEAECKLGLELKKL